MLTTIFNFLVTPTEENVVQLTSQEIKEILADSARLLEANKAIRAEVLSVYGKTITEAQERPSISFVKARDKAEAQTGSTFLKFFKL